MFFYKLVLKIFEIKMLVSTITTITYRMFFIEERKGFLQRLIKFFGNILLKLFRWLKPRRY